MNPVHRMDLVHRTGWTLCIGRPTGNGCDVHGRFVLVIRMNQPPVKRSLAQTFPSLRVGVIVTAPIDLIHRSDSSEREEVAWCQALPVPRPAERTTRPTATARGTNSSRSSCSTT